MRNFRWAAYGGVANLQGLTHGWVNHQVNFVNPNNPLVHTQGKKAASFKLPITYTLYMPHVTTDANALICAQHFRDRGDVGCNKALTKRVTVHTRGDVRQLPVQLHVQAGPRPAQCVQ